VGFTGLEANSKPGLLAPHKGAIALPYLQNPKQKSARIFFLFCPLSIAVATVERMTILCTADRGRVEFINDVNGDFTDVAHTT